MKTHRLAVGGFAIAAVLVMTGSGFEVGPLPNAPRTDARYKPIPDFVERGMDWLADAQFSNGGWGAGSHVNQDERDPHAVQTDPATTAFSAMALMRSGSTLSSGRYRTNISKALTYLLQLVEDAPPSGYHLTSLSGTQPQVKLGQNIDVSMATQFFSEILPQTRHDNDLHERVVRALDKCLHKLEVSQDADGSWNSQGGWAGVLQSAMANNALELAEQAGRDVDEDALARSREYQKGNLRDGPEGAMSVATESAAGIELYSIASNQRATAKEAKTAEDAVRQAVNDGRLAAEEEVTPETLASIGYEQTEAKRLAESYRKNRVATEMLESDAVLTGFGNNGGEEFLSYMMTSESLLVSGGEGWDSWHAKMHNRLARIQNADGSWSGHHCITSPVFCTAAAILTLTADRGPAANIGLG